jgi:hypothetical protein
MLTRHNQLTMIAPLDKNRREALAAGLERKIGYQRSDRRANIRLKRIAQLHFISMFTFVPPGEGGNREGYLVIEANFDGPVDDFLDEFTTQFKRPLNLILDCCGRRANESLTEFIRRHSYRPECFYVSCPGLTRPQIENERNLLERLQAETDRLVSEGAAGCRNYETVVERMSDAATAGGFLNSRPAPDTLLVKYGQKIVTVLGVLIPMIVIALLVLAIGPWPPLDEIGRQPLLAAALGLAIAAAAYWLVSTGTGILLSAVVLLGLLASAAGAAAVSRILPAEVFVASRFALAGLAIVIGAIILALYRIELLERIDGIETGWIDLGHMRTVCRDENSPACMQNHFINISVVKPGALRLWALRLVLWFIHLAGIVYFNRGKLGGIPSIHFARWVILEQEEFGLTLLMFLTNYDASWDSYLGDFVDDASEGVSGIWSNTGGFPRTWGLIFGGGSRSEKQFKAYARHGQQHTLAWFSAYPNVSVGQKLGNAAVRRALDKNPSRLKVSAQDALLRRL